MRPIIIETIMAKVLSLGLDAITIGPFVLVTRGARKNWQLINHESIHVVQWFELYLVGFVPVYLWYFVVGLVKLRSWDKAYRSIPLEREAFENQVNPGYIATRRPFAWRSYGH